MKKYVSASVLSADMLELRSEIAKLEKNGIDMLHFDVMDGIFVNNITFGLPVLQQVRQATDMTLDVHLMISEPMRYIKRFAEDGADIISFHIESAGNASEIISEIKKYGKKAALAIKPSTPAEAVFELLPKLDMVLVMTVDPGFGGQSFISDSVDKIRCIRKKIDSLGLAVDLQVDGGINAETSALVTEAGANVLVSGSYLFSAEDMKKAAQLLREEIKC